MRVYLGGSIWGKSFAEAADWREEAARLLEASGHEVLDPMRNRMWNAPEEQAQFTPNELAARDRRDVMRADVLLVECAESDRNYIGTTVEMTWARDWSKLIVVFAGGRKYSPWLDYLATKVFDTATEAIEYICYVLGD